MDDPDPKSRITLTPDEATMAQVRRSAERDRRTVEDDALNKIQPGSSEKARAVWQGEGGRIAEDRPLPTIHPRR